MLPQPLQLRALVVAEVAVTVAENKKGLLVAIGADVGDPLLKPPFVCEQRQEVFPLRGIGLPSAAFDPLFQFLVRGT